MLQGAINAIQAKVVWRTRYDNFIGGGWVPPMGGEYFTNISPITGKPIAEIQPPTPAPAMRNWMGARRSTGKILGDIVGPTGALVTWK